MQKSKIFKHYSNNAVIKPRLNMYMTMIKAIINAKSLKYAKNGLK